MIVWEYAGYIVVSKFIDIVSNQSWDNKYTSDLKANIRPIT